MYRKCSSFIFLLFFLPLFLTGSWAIAQETQGGQTNKSEISISEEMTDAMAREAAKVKEQIKSQAKNLFSREPFVWDFKTVKYIYEWLISIPFQIPEIIKNIEQQARTLGPLDSVIILAFFVAVLYGFFGQGKIIAKTHGKLKPLVGKLPDIIYPVFSSVINIIAASLIPLFLYGSYLLINALILFEANWFLFVGRLLELWVIGVFLIKLLRELLTSDLLPIDSKHNETVFRLGRLTTLYVLISIAIFRGAQAFEVPADVLGFIRFIISLSIVLVIFLFLLKKQELLSLLPDIPYPIYRGFVNLVHRYYYPIIFFTLATGILWCLRYKFLATQILLKTWAVAAAFVVIMIFYHFVQVHISKWQAQKGELEEAGEYFFKSIKRLVRYTTIIIAVLIILDLLGLFGPLQVIMSFPVFQIGEIAISFWILIKAIILLVAFFYFSKMLQAYLDYKVYSSLGVDEGLAYAINTFLHYLILIIAAIVSLRIVGLDLKVLMVFAGALGIGIGFGLQSMAANIISGFTLIFGGKLRKGDWIQVGETVGVVTDIFLRVTKVRTRDNIEYLIPNADFISTTFINYTLSSPTIRISVPVGVSYDADPEKVREILRKATEKDPLAIQYRKPQVRFVGYGDNSIDFQILIWIDVRKTAFRFIRSRLFFLIFNELKSEGIEIPFPQRDLHIRSGVPWTDLIKKQER